MKYEIDEADLGAWRENVAKSLELISGLPYNFKKDFYWLDYNDRNELLITLGNVYNAIGVTVENSREAKSN